MEKKRRKVIVSRFETFTDVFRFEDCKSVGSLTINSKDQTIGFAHESGDVPTLYIILMVMSVNINWLQIVDNFERPADMSRYFLLTRWINFESSNFYLCHEQDDGVTVIDKCLIKCSDGGGIKSCTLSQLDYLLLVEHDTRFSFTTLESRIKELREDYEFKYLK